MGINAPVWQQIPTVSPPRIKLPSISFLTGGGLIPPTIQDVNPEAPPAPSQILPEFYSTDLDVEIPDFPEFIKLITELETIVSEEIQQGSGSINYVSDRVENRNNQVNTTSKEVNNNKGLTTRVGNKEDRGDIAGVGEVNGKSSGLSHRVAESHSVVKATENQIGSTTGYTRVNEDAIREKIMFNYYKERKSLLNKMAQGNFLNIPGAFKELLMDLSLQEKQEIIDQTLHTNRVFSKNLAGNTDEVGRVIDIEVKQENGINTGKNNRNEIELGIGDIRDIENNLLESETNSIENEMETGDKVIKRNRDTVKENMKVTKGQSTEKTVSRDDSDLIQYANNYSNKVLSVLHNSNRAKIHETIAKIKSQEAAASASIKQISSYLGALKSYFGSKVDESQVSLQRESLNALLQQSRSTLLNSYNLGRANLQVAIADQSALLTKISNILAEASAVRANTALQSAYTYKEAVQTSLMNLEKNLTELEATDIRNQTEVEKAEAFKLKLQTLRLKAEAEYMKQKAKADTFNINLSLVKEILDGEEKKLGIFKEHLNTSVDIEEHKIDKVKFKNKLTDADNKVKLGDSKIKLAESESSLKESGYEQLHKINASGVENSVLLREEIESQVAEALADIDAYVAEDIANINANARVRASLSHAYAAIGG
jgi:hypothetical protein